MGRLITAALAWLVALTGAASGQHHTVRFFTTYGAPRFVDSLAFSPNSDVLAVAVRQGPVAIIDTATGETTSEIKFDPFQIMFSGDGKQILGIAGRSTKFLDPKTGKGSDVHWQVPAGYVGCVFKQQSGKVLVASVTPNSPAAEAQTIQVGDELTAIIRDKQVKSILGRSVQDVTKELAGPQGTSVTLRFVHKGIAKPDDIELRRKRATKQGEELVFRDFSGGSSPRSIVCLQNDNLLVLGANTGELLSIIHPVDVASNGRNAVSPDGRRLAVAGFRRTTPGEESDLGLEVFDVNRMERTHFVPVDSTAVAGLCFTPDGSKVLVGGFDRVIVYDLEKKAVAAPILIGFDPEVVQKEPKEQPPAIDIRPDLGFKRSNLIEAGRRLLASCDVSPDGKMVVIGGFNGNCSLWSTERHEKLADIGEPVEETKGAEEAKFSPDGRWVAYFVDGTLSIAAVPELKSSTVAVGPEDAASK